MNPQNDRQYGQVGVPQRDQSQYRGISPTPRPQQSQQAAANVIRGQLDSIYSGQSGEDTPHTTPTPVAQAVQDQATDAQLAPVQSAETPSPAQTASGHSFSTAPPTPAEDTATPQQSDEPKSTYQRTMTDEAYRQEPSKEDWQQYHSAWQKYYQLYYERHYMRSIYSQQKAEQQQTQADDAPAEEAPKDGTISQVEAMQELRNSIRKKITDSTQKVKKSRHFVPIMAGVVVAFAFIFLQFNRPIIGTIVAYASPGNIEPQNIITDPNVNIEVGPEPKMIIPKINVNAPVVYGVGPDHNSQMAAMEHGIAHFSIPGANAVPGQVGNTVMSAHSSNDVFAPGDYKFVFAHNERLGEGDVIYMHYEGTRYTYSVTHTEVVMPTEVSKVQLDTDKPMLTLISCVPLGTAEKRLLIFAEQVSPNPANAEQSESSTSDESAVSENMPGVPSPTLLERLFGAR